MSVLGKDSLRIPTGMYVSGPEVTGVYPGHNYLAYPWISCRQCPACLDGLENHCSIPQYLDVQRPDCYADHLLVPHPRARCTRYGVGIGRIKSADFAKFHPNAYCKHSQTLW